MPPQERVQSAEEFTKRSVALIHKQTECSMHGSHAQADVTLHACMARSKLYNVERSICHVSLNITADHVVVDGLLFEYFVITARVVLERVG